MKNISLLLIFLILLQSCNVYNVPTSLEAAVAENKRVKIFTREGQEYKFTRLENNNDKLIGITKSGSSTAKRVAGMPVVIDGEFLRVDLSNLDVERLRLRNESGSRTLTIVTVAGALAAAFFIYFLISIASTEWSIVEGYE